MCGFVKKCKIWASPLLIFQKVFLMLLQDTNKKSHVTPETKLDPQNEIPAGPSPQHGK